MNKFDMSVFLEKDSTWRKLATWPSSLKNIFSMLCMFFKL